MTWLLTDVTAQNFCHIDEQLHALTIYGADVIPGPQRMNPFISKSLTTK